MDVLKIYLSHPEYKLFEAYNGVEAISYVPSYKAGTSCRGITNNKNNNTKKTVLKGRSFSICLFTFFIVNDNYIYPPKIHKNTNIYTC